MLAVISLMSLASSVLPTTDKVTALGVILDSKLTFEAHIPAGPAVCKNAHFHLRALRHIGSSLTTDMATSIAVALVQSRIDYANSLLYVVSTRNIRKLQRCQNTAAHLILQQSFTPSIQDLMNQLQGSQSRPGLISKLPPLPTRLFHLVNQHTFGN